MIFSLINCKIEIVLRRTKNCIISEISRTFGAVGDPPEQELATTTSGATFQINNVKLYVPGVTLLVNDNISFSKYIRQGFKRTILWNKYRSEITTQLRNDNLDYLIDPTFINFNRLFVLSFKNGNDFLTRYSFDKYYMLLVEIKDFDFN